MVRYPTRHQSMKWQMILSPGFKKYFANTSWLMAERVLRMIVALFIGVSVARYLEPERYVIMLYSYHSCCSFNGK